MLRFPSYKKLLSVALCSALSAAMSVRHANADPTDVVDLEGDTHNNPPASTTDKSPPPPSTATEAENTVARGTTEAREAAKEEAAETKLKLRAGERVGNDARGSAQVLGMSLQETRHERVRVVDVAMNSPAFDAGVMKGDEVVSFQGFRGETYRKWIDGIRRITTDSSPGLKIPVTVDRDSKLVTVSIEVPVKLSRPSSPRTLAQPGSSLVVPAPPTTGGATGGPAAVSGGNNVVIDNSGPFGEFFGGQASPNESAVAQLVRIGGQPTPNRPGSSSRIANQQSTAQTAPSGATAAPVRGDARIGMAGFRDDPSGMVVMIDVGTLPPGNYTVAITDPSVIGGATITAPAAPNPNIQTPRQVTPPQLPAAPGEPGTTVPGATPPPAGTRQPQGNLPPASIRTSNPTVLAQVGATAEQPVAPTTAGTVADTIPATGQVRPSTIPATGQVNPSSSPPTGEVNPSTTPPTGNVNPSSSTPTGQSSVNNAQQAQMAREAAGGVASGTQNQIGTITVDQSGTGRMQQKVESMQVRNVVGQAIVLYSQGGSSQPTLPANLNGTASSATRQGVNDSTARDSQRPNDANGGQGSAASQTAALQPATSGAQVPVAGGIIQLVTDRRPPASIVPQTSQAPTGVNEAIEQPADAAPTTRQNLVR